jgi:hypothetical protein
MPAHNNRGIVTIRDVTRTAVAVERLGKHVSAETNSRNKRRAVFSVRSVQRGYKKRKRRSFKAVEFRDTSLPVYELGSRVVELRHQNYWVRFSGIESVAVKRRLYVCCSYRETVMKSVARIRLLKTENPSLYATVNWKVCRSEVAL